MAGVYTSPYTATIDGVSTLVICDDFVSNVSQGQTWSATVTSVSALPSSAVKFDTGSLTQQQDYATAAFLAEEILAQDQSNSAGQYQAGILSYALWGVFDSALLTTYQGSDYANCTSAHSYGCLTTTELNDATSALTYAQAHAGSFTQYSNVNVYTDINGTVQEFLTVPEPPAPALLAVYLSGLVGLILLFRRRVVRATS